MINKISYKPHISTINKTKNISFGNINLDIEAGVLNNFLNTLEDKKTKNQDMQKINNYIKNTIITTEIEDYNRNFKILGFNVNNEELNRPKFSINMETFNCMGARTAINKTVIAVNKPKINSTSQIFSYIDAAISLLKKDIDKTSKETIKAVTIALVSKNRKKI